MRQFHFGRLIDYATGEIFSQPQLETLIESRCQELMTAGIRSGSNILMRHNNRVSFFTDLLALWKMELTPVPIGNLSSDFEIEKIATETNAAGIFSEQGKFELRTSDKPVVQNEIIDLILVSSGTTGAPKAIEITKSLLKDRISNISQIWDSKVERGLCILPTSFGHGLIANCLSLWLTGRDLVIAPKLDLRVATQLARKIRDLEIHGFSSVPSHWPLLERTIATREANVFRLKQVHCASAPLDSKTYKLMRKIVGEASCVAHYGLTEMGSWITSGQLPESASDYIPGWVGQALATSISQDGEDNEISQVVIGPLNFSLSYTDLITSQYSRMSVGEKFRPGDLVSRDSQNALIIHGRITDFINKGGEKFSPAEIEGVLLRHPQVAEAIVFGYPNEISGESIAAVVVSNNLEFKNENDLKAHVRNFLQKNKVPNVIFFVNKIPISENGKLSRRSLIKIFKLNPK